MLSCVSKQSRESVELLVLYEVSLMRLFLLRLLYNVSCACRNVTGSDELIDVAMKSLRDFGFINYYGMQRFGTTRVTTHDIGRLMICSTQSYLLRPVTHKHTPV